jgi:hypothetical protein
MFVLMPKSVCWLQALVTTVALVAVVKVAGLEGSIREYMNGGQ